ncbi:hypothetical protein [Thermus caldifontis]|uniref:hypothetical protein n=1 Tax=Thermus caldifontis TaxID=1930763 RepID=UPI0013B4755F|nr:hypothetical protein [Thermus caldifontis]
MVGTTTQYAVIHLSPKEERLAMVVDLAALREALELAPGQFRLWSGGEAAVVPFVVLPDHAQEELTAFGHTLLGERPAAEVPAEVRFVMDEIGPMVWVRLQRGHLGILLEALLDPEAF